MYYVNQPTVVSDLNFDGTYFWISLNNGTIHEFDPVTETQVTKLSTTESSSGATGSAVLFAGSRIAAIDPSGTITTWRPCDGAVLSHRPLPGSPAGQVLLNGQY